MIFLVLQEISPVVTELQSQIEIKQKLNNFEGYFLRRWVCGLQY
jgi:hypothetical protein